MSTILFFAIIGCLALVLSWYLQNEREDADGEVGLLAIAEEEDPLTADDGGSYRIKPKREIRTADRQFLNERKNAKAKPSLKRTNDPDENKRFRQKAQNKRFATTHTSNERLFRQSNRVRPKK